MLLCTTLAPKLRFDYKIIRKAQAKSKPVINGITTKKQTKISLTSILIFHFLHILLKVADLPQSSVSQNFHIKVWPPFAYTVRKMKII